MSQTTHRLPVLDVELLYLADSGLELAEPADDVRGLVVVTPEGIRLGEVGDLVVDRQERRARLLSVLSGGILGLGATERLVPVEAITRVDERVHVDRSHAGDAYGGRRHDERSAPTESGTNPEALDPPFAEVYERYDVIPFWAPGYVDAAFLRR